MAYPDTILAEASLLSYWKLDEPSGTVADDAKGTADLAIAGGVTLGAPALYPGGIAAMTFARAANGRASRASSLPQYDWSIEGWFQASDTAAIRQGIVYNGSGTNGLGLFLNTDTVTNGHLFVLFQQKAWVDTGFSPGTTAHHFVLSRGAVGQPLKLYIDGLLVASSAETGNPPSGGFTVGAEAADGTYSFDGTIDDISTYSSALSAAKVAAHYTAGGGTVPITYTSAQSGDWGEQATWSSGLVPGATEVATISSGTVVTVSDARTVKGWLQQGSGVLALGPAAMLTSTEDGVVEGDSADTPKVTLAAGAKLLFAPGAGLTATLRLGTDYYRYAEVEARGTAGARCTVGKAVGSPGTFDIRHGGEAIWMYGLLDCEYTDLGDPTGTIALYPRHHGKIIFKHCTVHGAFGSQFYDIDPDSYSGLMLFEDTRFAGTFGISTANVGSTATFRRCEFASEAAFSGNAGAGTLTLERCVFRGLVHGSGWPAADVVSFGHLFFTTFGTDNKLLGKHNNFYHLIRTTSGGNYHFWDVDNGEFEDAVFEYDGPYELDTGDCAGGTLRRCLILPSSVPGKTSGQCNWGHGPGLLFEHCTLYVGDSYASLFPHSGAMPPNMVQARGNLIWSDSGGTGFFCDTPSFAEVDGINPLEVRGNAFVGLVASDNVVGGATASLVGFRDCKLSVAPSDNLELAAGAAAFVDPSRNFRAWARTVRGHTGSDQEVTDLAVADIVANRLLVTDSLLPWVRQGFTPTNPLLEDAAHDGTTPGAVPYAPAAPPEGEDALVAAWPLDETAGTTFADSVGTADLTAAGSVTLGTDPLSAVGTASATFLRSGLGRATHTSSYPETDVTVEGWFRCDDPATVNQCLWMNGSGPNGNALFYNGNGNSDGRFWLLVQGQGWVPLTYPPDDQAHHLVFTRAADGGRVILYVDGESVHDQYIAATSPPSGGFTVGAAAADGGDGFTGAIESVAVFATVLDADTVLARYRTQSGYVEPPYVPPTEAEIKAEWETNLYLPHHTGPLPYDGTHAPVPNQSEHYDPLCGFMNARDYCLRYGLEPDDWDTEINNAIAVWRDQFILIDAAGGQLQGYHTHTHGLARHYTETDDPLSLQALRQILPADLGDQAGYTKIYSWTYWQRENAFKLLGCLDTDLAGLGPHTAVHWAAECALGHCEHFTRTPAQRYGVFVRPFMWGLVLRSLVAYWFRYRDSADPIAVDLVARIPPAVEASVARIMEVAYWPPGERVPLAYDGNPEGWLHGAVKYLYPPGTAFTLPGGTHVPLTGLVIATRISADTFIGPPGLSAVDDYYKFLQYIGPGSDGGTQTYVTAYVGATRQFTIRGTWAAANVTAGDTFELHPQGWDDAGGQPCPDGASPALNPLVEPAAAWCFWHRKVVGGDPSGAALFRAHHATIRAGGEMAHRPSAKQKDWNEGLVWGASGVGYRDAGDAGTDTLFDPLSAEAPEPPTATGVRMLLRRNPTPGAIPAPEALSEGELALNTGDGSLYAKLADLSVLKIGGPAGGPYVTLGTAQTITAPKTFTQNLTLADLATPPTTSPTEAALFSQGGALKVLGPTYQQSLIGTMFSQIDVRLVSNTTTTTSLLGTVAHGTHALPPGFFTRGTMLRTRVSGFYETGASAVTGRWIVYMNGTQIGYAAASFLANQLNTVWSLEFDVLCRSVGTSGVGVLIGSGNHFQPGPGIPFTLGHNLFVIDTTATLYIELAWGWDVASPANKMYSVLYQQDIIRPVNAP